MTRQRGFTLLEVMVALAILAGGLVMVIQSAASNVAATQHMSRMGIAVDLARGKMYDIEERLLDPLHGFKEVDEELDGDFGDEGHKDMKWKVLIEKVEIPGLTSLGKVNEEGGAAGEGGEAPSDSDPEAGGIAGLMGGFLGGAGGGMAGLIFEPIKKVLEQGIRKVSLTVTYEIVTGTEELKVVAFFTDPAAVTRAMGAFGGGIPGAGGAGGGLPGGAGGGGATGGGSRR